MNYAKVRNARRVEEKVEKLPEEVDCKIWRTVTGSGKLWYFHKPCGDDDNTHGDGGGFMTIKKVNEGDDSPENFRITCKTCGEQYPYDL